MIRLPKDLPFVHGKTPVSVQPQPQIQQQQQQQININIQNPIHPQNIGEEMKFCSMCGKKIKKNALFCEYCGEKQ